MATKEILTRLNTADLTAAPFGQRTRIPMVNGVQTHAVVMRPRADISIAAGGGADGTLRNKGSVWALIDKVVVEENGRARTIVDGRVLRKLTEAWAPQQLDERTRLASGAIQANTILSELGILYFASPLMQRKQETAFMEQNHRLPLTLQLETVANPYARLIDGGTRVLTVNSFTVEIGQVLDKLSLGVPPVFVPVIREIGSEVISGNVSQLRVPLHSQHFLSAIVIQQLAGDFEVEDIVSAIALESDHSALHEGQFSYAFLKEMQQALFGGEVVEDDGYLVFNFLSHGRLSDALNPNADSNLRLVVDAAPSAVVGTSQIRVWAVELQRIPGLTASEVPFPV